MLQLLFGIVVLIGAIALVCGKKYALWILLIAVVSSFFGVGFSLLPFWEYLVPVAIKTSPNTMRLFIIFGTYIMNILLLIALFVLRKRIRFNKPTSNIQIQ